MMKVYSLLALVSGLTGATLLQVQDSERIPLTQPYADVWRVFVMLNAGISLGFLAKIIVKFSRLRLDPEDRLLRLIGGIAVAYFVLVLYIGLDLASRLGTDFVSWRTPVGMIAFVFSNVCLYRLKRRLRRILERSKGATVKMTLTDTSRSGPDIDLDNGNLVTTRPS